MKSTFFSLATSNKYSLINIVYRSTFDKMFVVVNKLKRTQEDKNEAKTISHKRFLYPLFAWL